MKQYYAAEEANITNLRQALYFLMTIFLVELVYFIFRYIASTQYSYGFGH